MACEPSYSGYQAPQQQAPLPPPPRGSTALPAVLSAALAKKTGDWNDMPMISLVQIVAASSFSPFRLFRRRRAPNLLHPPA